MHTVRLMRASMICALALALPATAWGQDDKLDTRFYVAPMASFADFEADTSERPNNPDETVAPEDDTSFTIAVGKPLNKYINAELYYFDFSGVADEDIDGAESDRDGYGFAGLFFPFRDTVPVFALAGFGFGDYAFDGYNLSDQDADADYFDYGLGITLPIPYIDFDYGVRLRAEYRIRDVDVELQNNQDLEFEDEIASVGLVIPLGAPPASPEPEPEPEPAPAPEPEPEPIDSDNDGVVDDQDQCPGTPTGTEVDADGCPVEKDSPIVLKGVTFEFNEATLTAQAENRLDNVVNALQEASEIQVRIEGHTDSKGSAAYNRELSQERADSVKRYLVEHGIAPDRLTTKGFGESQPVAPNTNPDGSDNPEGRAKNRRVELHVTDQ